MPTIEITEPIALDSTLKQVATELQNIYSKLNLEEMTNAEIDDIMGDYE